MSPTSVGSGSKRLIATVAALAVLGSLSGCGDDANSDSSTQLELPRPGGKAELGTVSMHLVDPAREDMSVPGKPREVMVQLWYPAAKSDKPKAGYMASSVARIAEETFALPEGALEQLRTHATESAAPADGTHPVILFSPGYGMERALGTSLVEELASRGYVVVAMDHTYDANVEFPGGRLEKMRPQEDSGQDLAAWDNDNVQLLPPRVADTRFVLDKLHGLQAGTNPDADNKLLPAGLGQAMDLSKVGMLGHSIGAATTAQVLLEDPRVSAGFLMDSPIPKQVREAGIDQPILLIRSDQPEIAAVLPAAWEAFQPRGWSRNLRLVDSMHNSFTDLSVFSKELGKNLHKDVRATVGTIDGDKAVAAQRAYTTAFFDQHLKGQPQALLDAPSKEYPQVEFLPQKPQRG